MQIIKYENILEAMMKILLSNNLLKGKFLPLVISLMCFGAGDIMLVNAQQPTPPQSSSAKTTSATKPAADEIHLLVKLGDRKVYVYRGETKIASYPIAVGKKGWETPQGNFQVINKEVNPIFKSFRTGKEIGPGAENPLGVRWIGIWEDEKNQLGFHGTNQPELIGKAVSHGCIRMHNKDVVSLFEKVKIGTIVKVMQ